MLVWEWKALLLPAGGDVRYPRRNDQVARLMLLFGGMRVTGLVPVNLYLATKRRSAA